MPLYALTDADDIAAARQRFAERLQDGAVPYECGVGWRGGGGAYAIFWQPTVGIWGLEDEETNGYWFGFGADDPAPRNAVGNLIAQFGFVREGAARKRAAVFARDDQDGAVHLLHSGWIRSSRPGVTKAAFLAAYQGPMIPVIWPNGNTVAHISVGPLEAPDLIVRIAAFVQAVETFKDSVAFPVVGDGAP